MRDTKKLGDIEEAPEGSRTASLRKERLPRLVILPCKRPMQILGNEMMCQTAESSDKMTVVRGCSATWAWDIVPNVSTPLAPWKSNLPLSAFRRML